MDTSDQDQGINQVDLAEEKRKLENAKESFEFAVVMVRTLGVVLLLAYVWVGLRLLAAENYWHQRVEEGQQLRQLEITAGQQEKDRLIAEAQAIVDKNVIGAGQDIKTRLVAEGQQLYNKRVAETDQSVQFIIAEAQHKGQGEIAQAQREVDQLKSITEEAAAQLCEQREKLTLPSEVAPSQPEAVNPTEKPILIYAKPSISSTAVLQLKPQESLPVNGRNESGSWWQVETKVGPRWIQGAEIIVSNQDLVPVIKP